MIDPQALYTVNTGDDVHPLDVHIGRKMRMLRTLTGKTQSDLAEVLGVTYQQVQKYETGQSRMMATRLFDFAKKMGVDIAYFFDDFSAKAGLAEEGQQGFESGPVEEPLDRTALELLRTFLQVQNPKARRLIIDLAKTLAEESSEALKKVNEK